MVSYTCPIIIELSMDSFWNYNYYGSVSLMFWSATYSASVVNTKTVIHLSVGELS